MAPNKRLPQHKIHATSTSNNTNTNIEERAFFSSSIGAGSNETNDTAEDGSEPNEKFRRRLFRSCSLWLSSSTGTRAVSSSLASLAPSNRHAMSVLTILAMSSVSFGIIVLIFVNLAPLNGVGSNFVAIEKQAASSYSGGTTTTTSQRQQYQYQYQHYKPSRLKAYVLENGRTNKQLGYDRQVVRDKKETEKRSRLLTSIPPPLIPVAMISRLFASTGKGNTGVRRANYKDPQNTVDMPSGCEL